MNLALLFPHQLYLIDQLTRLKADEFWLIEDSLFFSDPHYPLNFHQQKLVLHRASMKAYYHLLENHGLSVSYFNYHSQILRMVFELMSSKQVTGLSLFDPTDYILEKRLMRLSVKHQLPIKWHESPNFLTKKVELKVFFSAHKRYHQTDFYIWQRQRLGILLEADGKPTGGHWTYDAQNRKKLLKTITPAKPISLTSNDFVEEAKTYVTKHFGDHPGSLTEFNYPINHHQAEQVLDDFIAQRLTKYGPYQDAMTNRSDTVFHSLLTPALNIGLLSPRQIINQVLDHADKHDVPLSSLEGFIRQVIGWREFMRAMYLQEGVKIRNSNFFGHDRSLNDKWYQGNTGVEPVDQVIQKVWRTGYAHHIERLMVLGNFMLLSRLDPDEVYRWFMEMFIDSYDWVMAPNVYSMSQYADGGLLTTKPYVSGSNYIRKMSDYPAGDWCAIWDSLYWSFLSVHKTKLANNPRMSLMIRLMDKMDQDKINRYLESSDKFLQKLEVNYSDK